MMANKAIRTALISVFYKNGIDALAMHLHKNGVKIISTGGTQKHLEALGIPVVPVESLTTYPPILDGRVKTLHPAIFGGILDRSGHESDKLELESHHIGSIDLVWVDLYPFTETVQNSDVESEIIEKIDIGGVSLIRAAAKNFNDKLVISNQDQIDEVLSHIAANNNESSLAFRREMAYRAFKNTEAYDGQIARYFGGESTMTLRYGENPHQTATFEGNIRDVFDQIHGKEISYNNLLDIDAALKLIGDFKESEAHVFAILKHNNACGLAIRSSLELAYKAALEADPISAFGGILVTRSTIDEATAHLMNDLFFEVLLAPDFDDEALAILKGKKNRILLKTKTCAFPIQQVRSVLNGMLVQDADVAVNEIKDFQTVTSLEPSPTEMNDLFFANVLVKHTKSNAIILVKNQQLLASGTGQTSRVDALNQAIAKAKSFGYNLKGASMASDAFFPFPDCVEIAHTEGIKCVIQPGGSIKDQLSIDYCNEHDLSMVVTGMRHFKH